MIEETLAWPQKPVKMTFRTFSLGPHQLPEPRTLTLHPSIIDTPSGLPILTNYTRGLSPQQKVFQPTGQRESWYVPSSPTSEGGGCRGGSRVSRGNMAAPACSVRYFCLGALLIFVGSVLLCALGFTVVLPHEATSDWPRAICTVVNATYNKAHCSCDQQVTEYDRCVERYPCLQVTVGFNKTTHQGPAHGGVTRAAFATGILYRNWVDSFFRMCSIHECGDEEWNVKEAHRFRHAWGRPGQVYPCYYNPNNDTSLVLERMPTSYVIHALFWPSLSLLSGTMIWMGLCFGCWRIEIENTYPQRHGGTYARGPYGML